MELGFILLMFLFFPLSESLTSINQNIPVEKYIYQQHDTWNNSIYSLSKSGEKYTIVYQDIFPIFTPSMVWLKNGTMTKNFSPQSHQCTSPDNFIPVQEGEEYFFKIYGVGKTKINETTLQYTPILFLDKNNKYITDLFSDTKYAYQKGVTVTIPKGATKMHITYCSLVPISIQKVLKFTDEQIDKVISEKDMISKVNQTYENYQKDPTVYKKLEKAFITFVNHDSLAEITDFVDLFLSMNVPICLATLPGSLKDGAKGGLTKLDVVKKLINSGKGEILSLESTVMTQQNIENYTTLYTNFIRSKQIFSNYGIDVNGIILKGGSGQITGGKDLEKWASSFFAYGDAFGVVPNSNYKSLIIDSVYYHRTTGLSKLKNNITALKESIDNDIAKKNFNVYSFRNYDEIKEEVLKELLTYVKEKEKQGLLEIGTYQQIYEKKAISLQKLISTKHTYYVSASGTSNQGTSVDDPMSFKTMLSKVYLSGDTIFLKRGDTFYGKIDLKVTTVDDSKLIIRPYGGNQFPKPILSGYKIVKKNECWEKIKDQGGNLTSIYKIDLTNSKNFEGVQAIDSTTNQIGYLQDKQGNKYYHLVRYLENITEVYDFCCDGTYLYIKTNGSSPYKELGELKLATKTYLFSAHSNLIIKNIHFQGTGGHAIEGSDSTEENIEVVDCIIEDIGGSYLKGSTRYGNGIQFYASHTKNIHIHRNIIRNCYDVGFTIQGSEGSGQDVLVEKNVFVTNSQDSEIWENDKAKGVYNYVFQDNISINQGRCWGYDARPDKSAAGSILFWGYNIPSNTKIRFYYNYFYNPFRIYYIAAQGNTSEFFKENYIDSDHNIYYMNNDTWIFRYNYRYGQRDQFKDDYHKDYNSTFIKLSTIDENLTSIASISYNYTELRAFFVNETYEADSEDEPIPQKKEEQSNIEKESKKEGLSVLIIVLIVSISVLILVVGFILIRKKILRKSDSFENYSTKQDNEKELILN